MKCKWIDESSVYDGSQLKARHIYLNHGIIGDAVIAWCGPCRVKAELMVDGEDWLAGAEIRGDDMVHFIAEIFDCGLLAAVGFQRLLSALAFELISRKVKDAGTRLRREGDDLYWGEGKLSISIATLGLNSGLIHFAVNVTNSGTPVVTSSLNDLGLEVKAFALELMENFCREVESARAAGYKVRPV